MKSSKGSKPRKWNDERCRQAYHYALLGATDRQLAEFMDVEIHTIDHWKETHPGFLQALREGKEVADAKAAKAFFKCVNGYEYEEDHVVVLRTGEIKVIRLKKYKGPDAWAANKWLSLRQKAVWSETQKIELTQTNILNLNKFDFSKFTTEDLMVLKKLGLQQTLEVNGSGVN